MCLGWKDLMIQGSDTEVDADSYGLLVHALDVVYQRQLGPWRNVFDCSNDDTAPDCGQPCLARLTDLGRAIGSGSSVDEPRRVAEIGCVDRPGCQVVKGITPAVSGLGSADPS